MTIASEITRIKTNIENTYAKAEEKGATMPEVLNSDALAECIESIPKGSGEYIEEPITPEGFYRVRFYDIDGTILNEQILEEGSEVTEFPETPHYDDERLIFDNWNYYTNKNKDNPKVYGHLNFGAIYKTVNEYIYIKLDINEETGKYIQFLLAALKPSNYHGAYSSKYIVDFGDGNSVSNTFSVQANTGDNPTVAQDIADIKYTYAEYGEYWMTIKCEPIEGIDSESAIAGYGQTIIPYSSSSTNKKNNLTSIKKIYLNTSATNCLSSSLLATKNEVLSLYQPMFTDYSSIGDEKDAYSVARKNYCHADSGNWNDNPNLKHINMVYGAYTMNNTGVKSFSLFIGHISSMFSHAINLRNVNNLEECVLVPKITDSNPLLYIKEIDTSYSLRRILNTHFKNGLYRINKCYKLGSITYNSSDTYGVDINDNISAKQVTVKNLYMTSGGKISGSLIDNVFFDMSQDEIDNIPSNTSVPYLPTISGARLKEPYRLRDGVYFKHDTEQAMFDGCYLLEEIDYSKSHPNLKNLVCASSYSFRNCYSLKKIKFPESFESLKVGSREQFTKCFNLDFENIIPYLDFSDITSNIQYLFDSCYCLNKADLSNKNLNTSQNVSYFFNQCPNLTSVKLPQGSYKSGGYNFYQCKSLSNVDLGGLTTLSTYEFYMTPNLQSIDLSNITSVSGSYVLAGCGVKKIWIPSTLSSLPASSAGSSNNLLYNVINRQDLIVYTDATSKPSGWGTYWNYIDSSTQAKVYWGATKENYENGDPIPA